MRRHLLAALLAAVTATLFASRLTSAAPAEEPRETTAAGVRWGFMPVLSYSTDRGQQLGLLTRRFDYGGQGIRPFESLLTLQAVGTNRGAHDLFTSYETIAETWRTTYEASVYRNDRENFFGIGETPLDPAARAAGAYTYALRVISTGIAVRRPTGLGFDAQLGLRLTRYSAETDRDHARLIAQAIWERRDSEFSPSRGWFGLVSAQVAPSLSASSAAWTRVDLDYRRYDRILSERDLWLATQLRHTTSSESAPPLEKARLGSLGTLRGLPLSRYLWDHSLIARAELRSVWLRKTVFDLPLKVGSGIFVDTGKIADTLGGLASARVHASWGLSLFGSYFSDDFLCATDVAQAEGERAVYVRLGHAF